MKPAPSRLLVIPLPLLLLATLLPSPAKAIQIDFESGYTTTAGGGDLLNQPATGTKWTSATASGGISIAAKDGATGTDQAAKTQPLTSSSYGLYTFTPSDADLGIPFNATSSVIKYSFQVKLDDEPNGGNGVALRVHLGGKAVGFDLLSNGGILTAVGKSDGTRQAIFATSADGNRFQAKANTYVTVEGTLDYSTKTFTASVNGVAIMQDGNPKLDFADKSADTFQIDLMMISNTSYTSWIPASIDNINLTAVK